MTDEPAELDPVTVARRALQEQLNQLRAGVLRLRVARPNDQLRRYPETHFHIVPELYLQVEGTSRLATPDRVLAVPAQTVCLTPRGVPHRERCHCPGGGFLNVVFICHSDELLNWHVATGEDGSHPSVRAGRRVEHPDLPRLIRYLDEIVTARWSGSPRRGRLVRSLLEAHLLGLLDVVEQAPPRRRRREHEKVARTRELIMIHLCEPDLSVRQLARWVSCAPDYLSHLFHAETGVPLAQHINRERVAFASRLLEDPTLNISEIAWASGFADPGYFARIFRRLTGHSPREHRRSFATRERTQ